MPGKRAPASERFWRHVKTDEAGCWDWTSSLNPAGYGQFKATAGSPPVRAHRFSWALHFGLIPDGLLVCHHCDNRRCVRPNHLFLGTYESNTQDAIRKGRMGHIETWHRAGVGRNRKLSNADIRVIRRRHANGESGRSIARSYGVANTTISRWVNDPTGPRYPEMLTTAR